jgi:hypothetical protein
MFQQKLSPASGDFAKFLPLLPYCQFLFSALTISLSSVPICHKVFTLCVSLCGNLENFCFQRPEFSGPGGPYGAQGSILAMLLLTQSGSDVQQIVQNPSEPVRRRHGGPEEFDGNVLPGYLMRPEHDYSHETELNFTKEGGIPGLQV